MVHFDVPYVELPPIVHRQKKPHVIDAARVRSEHRLRGNWTLARSVGAAWLQADASQGRTRTRGIVDAEVAVPQDETNDRTRSRASVKSLCHPIVFELDPAVEHDPDLNLP